MRYVREAKRIRDRFFIQLFKRLFNHSAFLNWRQSVDHAVPGECLTMVPDDAWNRINAHIEKNAIPLVAVED